MDFDHRDGSNKETEISNMARLGSSWKSIEQEIKKCDLVCACCHRIRTEQRASAA